MGKRKPKDPGINPLQAEAKLLCDEATGHLKASNYQKALFGYNQALQLCPEDKTALVARSKCYLLLGQPRLALQDAETALGPDRNFVRAIFQKAEALYHMGDFEHSLMYYHRGLRLRPELAVFRLGVQKAQEAIENTIGRSKGSMRARLASPSSGRHSASGHSSGSAAPSPAPGAAVGGLGPRPAVVTPTADAAADPPAGLAASRVSSPTTPSTLPTQPTLTTPGSARSRSSRSSRSSRDNRYPGGGDASSNAGDEEQSARRLLGELCVDKLYLEQLLRHPDIQCARKDRNRSAQIAVHAEDGVEFLRNRQEFWRQQKLSAAPAPPPAAAAAPPGAGGGARRRMGTPASGGSTARDAVVPAATATPVS